MGPAWDGVDGQTEFSQDIIDAAMRARATEAVTQIISEPVAIIQGNRMCSRKMLLIPQKDVLVSS